MAKLRTVLTIQYADELPPEESVMPAEPIEKKKEKKEKKSGLLSKVGGFFSSLFGIFKGKKVEAEEPEEPEEEPTLVEPEPPAVDRKARKEALIQKASEIVKQHQENIGRPYPPASRPGEYPALRTGKMRKNVYFKPRTAESLDDNSRVKIGYRHTGRPNPAMYSEILESPMKDGSNYGGRLGIDSTVSDMNMSNQFGQIEIRYPGDRS